MQRMTAIVIATRRLGGVETLANDCLVLELPDDRVMVDLLRSQEDLQEIAGRCSWRLRSISEWITQQKCQNQAQEQRKTLQNIKMMTKYFIPRIIL